MTLLGFDCLFTGLSLQAVEVPEVIHWLILAWIVKSVLPASWLGFSMVYSRGDYRELSAMRICVLAAVALLPLCLTLGFQQQTLVLSAATETNDLQLNLGPIGKLVNVLLLVLLVCVLMNLEQTFRAAVGTTRWRIKYVILGLAVIFGARIYVRSQALLFAGYDLNWAGIESAALLIGCTFLVVAHLRSGSMEIDLYPSRAVLSSSMTIFIAGGYLFIVGVLANLVKRYGGVDSLQVQSLVVLVGLVGLAVLLLSDRLRQIIHGFVNRHFARAQYDSVRIWTVLSLRLANVKDEVSLSTVSAKLISEIFEVLSVTVWLWDPQKEQFFATASTAALPEAIAAPLIEEGLSSRIRPFNLEEVNETWADPLRQHNMRRFPNGGDRWCAPLRSGERVLGALILADRINGAKYTFEQTQLLQCAADQITSVLLNMQLANEVARARELEAFRTMSAFFVHDLKNTASSLNMMLKNLPVHFDNPEFRSDALRAIGNAAKRIEEMIERLSTFRQKPSSRPVEADLNQLVSEALERLDQMPQVEVVKELHPLPRMLADREQIQSVVTNLVLNARDALGHGGHIQIRTEHHGANVVLSVSDDGCGMSPAFVTNSLFRPFQTTKKKGLGIGMFQSRMIVEAHGGNIKVESEAGKGSTFRVSLPVKN